MFAEPTISSKLKVWCSFFEISLSVLFDYYLICNFVMLCFLVTSIIRSSKKLNYIYIYISSLAVLFCGLDFIFYLANSLRCWPSCIVPSCYNQLQCKDSDLFIGDSFVQKTQSGCKVTSCIYRGHNGGKIYKR